MKIVDLYQRVHNAKSSTLNLTTKSHTECYITEAILIAANRTKKHKRVGMMCVEARYLDCNNVTDELTDYVINALTRECNSRSRDDVIKQLAYSLVTVYCDKPLLSKRSFLARLHAKHSRNPELVKLRIKRDDAVTFYKRIKPSERDFYSELLIIIEQTKLDIKKLSLDLVKDTVCPKCHGSAMNDYISCSTCDSTGIITATTQDVKNQLRKQGFMIDAQTWKGNYAVAFDKVLDDLYEKEREARDYMHREFNKLSK